MTDSNNSPGADASNGCTTTNSFDDHGLVDGGVLIRETYYRLVDAGLGSFDPTERYFDQLESAFLWSYIGLTDENGIPPHVEAAIDDGRALTYEAFREQPDADLRTDVLPAFYQQVAGFHCLYRK